MYISRQVPTNRSQRAYRSILFVHFETAQAFVSEPPTVSLVQRYLNVDSEERSGWHLSGRVKRKDEGQPLHDVLVIRAEETDA